MQKKELLTTLQNSLNTSEKTWKLISVILLVVSTFVCTWLYIENRQARNRIFYLSTSEAQQEISQQESDNLISEVGKLIELPADQQPVVITIQDVEVLAQQQSFFLGAENGDKLLVYQNKAIIYSPAKNKLINVGPVYAQNNSEPNNEETEPNN